MSVRRNVRLRREYLYRKGLEGKERALYDHKQQLKEAIRSTFNKRHFLAMRDSSKERM